MEYLKEIGGISQVQKYFADRERKRRQVRWAKYMTRFQKTWDWIKKYNPTMSEWEVIIVSFGIIFGLIGFIHYLYIIDGMAGSIIRFKFN